MKRSFAIIALLALLFVINAWGDNPAIGSLTDSRDAQTYKTVKIGNQVWMAENLRYKNKQQYSWSLAVAKLNKNSDSASVVPRDKYYESAIRCVKD